MGREVQHDVMPRQRAARAIRVQQVEGDRVRAPAREQRALLRRAGDGRHAMAARDELRDHPPADDAGRSGDQHSNGDCMPWVAHRITPGFEP